jgi:hypothetical protein
MNEDQDTNHPWDAVAPWIPLLYTIFCMALGGAMVMLYLTNI